MTTRQIISACDDILKELSKFSENILFLGEPTTDKRILQFEKQIAFPLPLDFRYLLSLHNSFSLSGTEVLGLGEEFKGASLENVYQFEHREVGNPMLAEFLPFSPDGAGNQTCLFKVTYNLPVFAMPEYSAFLYAGTEVDYCFIVEDNICRLIIYSPVIANTM